ncbi:MAG: aminotransferase class I/II-fold pyridoxal phosphate-dependent enzyme, partial [Candidatus Margulisiibacteriota bacterium]
MSTFTPHIASRLDKVSESVTLKIDALAKKLKAEGQDVVGFGAGEPDFDTPQSIKKAAENAIEKGKTKYTPVSGIPEIRAAVAKRLQDAYGVTYAPEQVVVSCGAKHSIFNAMMAIVEPGDEIIIPAPYWVSYPEQVLLLGGRPVFLPTSDKTRFKITPDQLKAALTPKTKLIILNSPSNPSGMV